MVGIGPGLLTAADDDGAIVIDCDNYVIVPTVVDTAQLRGLRPTSFRSPTAIAPGNPAGFAILPAVSGESESAAVRRFLTAPPDIALTVVVDGDIVLWDGHPVEVACRAADTEVAHTASSDRYLGTWIDENDFVHQHLTTDGRYDETRGGRPHAYQARTGSPATESTTATTSDSGPSANSPMAYCITRATPSTVPDLPPTPESTPCRRFPSPSSLLPVTVAARSC